MTKVSEITYAAAILLFGIGILLADSLMLTLSGFTVLFVIFTIAGALVLMGNKLERKEAERERNEQ